jgi:hypothetical protein
MIRVRIKKLPESAKGGVPTGTQVDYSLHTGTRFGNTSPDSGKTNDTLSPVDRSQANIEAEKGETVVGDFDNDGSVEHFKIGGKRHSQGGTPLSVPAGSFIFSDTKKMKLGGPVLENFGKNPKKKYTPAQIAKQYDINDYKELSKDPNSDKLDKQTAELMIQNNQKKLGELALVQEAKKGFPDGIPQIAMPVLQPDQQEGQMKFGGLVKARNGVYIAPPEKHNGDRTDPREFQKRQLNLKRGFNQTSTPWLSDYGYSNDGTGMDQVLQDVGYSGNLNNTKEIQKFLVNENIKRGNAGIFNDLRSQYGLTNQAVNKYGYKDVPGSGIDPEDLDSPFTHDALNNTYVDGVFGVRSGLLLKNLLSNKDPKYSSPAGPVPMSFGKPNVNGPSINYSFPDSPSYSNNTPDQQTQQTQQQDPQFRQPGRESMPWWSQDKINFAAAAQNRYGIKKYMPTFVGANVVLPNPTFYDPTRQLAANQEQAAQQNMMAGMFAGPQRARAVGSSVQGQGMTIAANVLGQTENQNVSVANQFEGMRNQLLNTAAGMNASAKKQYLDELATVNQQYDNSVQQGNEGMRMHLINGMGNAQNTYLLNKMNDQYNIDPSTGRIMFTKGKSFSGAPTGSSQMSADDMATYKQHYNKFYNAMSSLPQDKRVEFANAYANKMMFGTKSQFRTDEEGNASMSVSGNGMVPQALQMLGMYSPQFLQRGR